MSNSALTKPFLKVPYLLFIFVILSNISIGGSGNLALPSPKKALFHSLEAHCSYNDFLFHKLIMIIVFIQSAVCNSMTTYLSLNHFTNTLELS